eukprot:358587-Chlamydomonas_euryale.AAC.3
MRRVLISLFIPPRSSLAPPLFILETPPHISSLPSLHPSHMVPHSSSIACSRTRPWLPWNTHVPFPSTSYLSPHTFLSTPATWGHTPAASPAAARDPGCRGAPTSRFPPLHTSPPTLFSPHLPHGAILQQHRLQPHATLAAVEQRRRLRSRQQRAPIRGHLQAPVLARPARAAQHRHRQRGARGSDVHTHSARKQRKEQLRRQLRRHLQLGLQRRVQTAAPAPGTAAAAGGRGCRGADGRDKACTCCRAQLQSERGEVEPQGRRGRHQPSPACLEVCDRLRVELVGGGEAALAADDAEAARQEGSGCVSQLGVGTTRAAVGSLDRHCTVAKRGRLCMDGSLRPVSTPPFRRKSDLVCQIQVRNPRGFIVASYASNVTERRGCGWHPQSVRVVSSLQSVRAGSSLQSVTENGDPQRVDVDGRSQGILDMAGMVGALGTRPCSTACMARIDRLSAASRTRPMDVGRRRRAGSEEKNQVPDEGSNCMGGQQLHGRAATAWEGSNCKGGQQLHGRAATAREGRFRGKATCQARAATAREGRFRGKATCQARAATAGRAFLA